MLSFAGVVSGSGRGFASSSIIRGERHHEKLLSPHNCATCRQAGVGTKAQARAAASWQVLATPGQPALRTARLCASSRHRCSTLVQAAAAGSDALPGGGGALRQGSQQQQKQLLAWAGTLALVAVGVTNRVLYKLVLVPMGPYVFFLAQALALAYCAVYLPVLALRYRSGKVPAAMLRFALSRWRLFLGVGLCDTASLALGFLGASQLPGVVLPLMQQTFMVWQLLFNRLLLGKRFSATQLAAVGCVITGVSLAASSTHQRAASAASVGAVPLVPACLFLSSMLFPALVSVLKERLFVQARTALGGRQLDIFVVNSSSSVAQVLCTLGALPLLANVQGISNLGQYVSEGLSCLRGVSLPGGGDCSSTPLLAMVYISSNILFNVLALWMLRQRGSVAMSLSMAPVVPLTVAAFALLPLPMLVAPPQLTPRFMVGVLVLMGGLALWNLAGSAAAARRTAAQEAAAAPPIKGE